MVSASVRILAGAAVAAALAACSAATAAPGSGPAPASGVVGMSDNLPGRFEIVGRGPVEKTHTSDLWVFRAPDNRVYAYTGTWGGCDGCYGDRMYAWDVTDPANPVLTDSVKVDARVVNDVKVNQAGTLAVITREGASSRRNGIVVLDLADPAHPAVASEFFETVTGGVHNTFIVDSLVYAVHNGTSDIHIINIADPKKPQQVGRWGVPVSNAKSLHDIWVVDGIAYVSYWDDGLIILDVGNGIKGGTPTEPELVGQYRYRTEWQGRSYGNTHVALPYTNQAGNRYIFVGDEIFPPNASPNEQVVPGGYIHVVDASNLENPVEVAKYEIPGAGAHNLWVENDTLYIAYYNGGLRAIDVSGELRGNLRGQNREIAVLSTGDARAYVPDAPFTWGPQVFEGLVYASDFNSGLWIARLLPNN